MGFNQIECRHFFFDIHMSYNKPVYCIQPIGIDFKMIGYTAFSFCDMNEVKVKPLHWNNVMSRNIISMVTVSQLQTDSD